MECQCRVLPASAKYCLGCCGSFSLCWPHFRSSVRDAQRLRRGPNAWISFSLPSAVDGKDTVMSRRVYLTCVRRLLGLSVLSDSAPCPLCKQNMDVYGDHPYAVRSQVTQSPDTIGYAM